VEAVLTIVGILFDGNESFAALFGAEDQSGGGEQNNGHAETEQGVGGITVVGGAGMSGVRESEGRGEKEEGMCFHRLCNIGVN